MEAKEKSAYSPGMMINALKLAQDLIRCPSITPENAGALDVLETALKPLGFECHRLVFEDPDHAATDNLYARIGSGRPHFCFAGHTDVVDPGDRSGWTADPFAAEVRDGILIGRGASDMKSEIACFADAVSRFLNKGAFSGTISFLITGDEEGTGFNGTPKLRKWLEERGEKVDHMLFGEPTSIREMGDTLKIGRRGSVNVEFIARGLQGHVAYANELKNPVHAMAALVDKLASTPLDHGTELFDPSTLSFTTFDVGNPTVNIVPAEARARLNIRFSDLHTPDSLIAHIEGCAREVTEKTGCPIKVIPAVSGVASVEQPGPFTDILAKAIAKVTGKMPDLSTSGGTSDARFMTGFAACVEFGLFTESIHKVDENAAVADIEKLADIYEVMLTDYFTSPPVLAAD